MTSPAAVFATERPRPAPLAWLVAVNAACAALRSGALDAPGWQAAMGKLAASLDRPALLAAWHFDAMAAGVAWRERGETSLVPQIPAAPGLERPLAFMPRVFALRRARAIPPHAHDNMASAFIVLRGVVQARLWNRVDGGGAGQLALVQALDRTLAAGDHVTMTETCANVHGFRAVSATAFLLDVNVSRLRAGRTGRRVYVDASGAAGPDGVVAAPVLSQDEACRRFG
jgi:hypothetical protein